MGRLHQELMMVGKGLRGLYSKTIHAILHLLLTVDAMASMRGLLLQKTWTWGLWPLGRLSFSTFVRPVTDDETPKKRYAVEQLPSG